MKKIFGLLLVLAGIVVGVYVGVYLCFVVGIINIIEAIRADVLVAKDVAWAVARIMCAGLLGGLSAIIFIIPGMGFLSIGD
jgi:hypothetical protein